MSFYLSILDSQFFNCSFQVATKTIKLEKIFLFSLLDIRVCKGWSLVWRNVTQWSELVHCLLVLVLLQHSECLHLPLGEQKSILTSVYFCQVLFATPMDYLHKFHSLVMFRGLPQGIYHIAWNLCLLLADRAILIGICASESEWSNMLKFSPSLHCCRYLCIHSFLEPSQH